MKKAVGKSGSAADEEYALLLEELQSIIDVINVQKVIINVYKRVYNDIFTKRL